MPLVFTAVFFARDDSRIGAYIEELPATHAVGDTIDDARVVMRKPLTAHDGHCKEVDHCGRKHSRFKDH